MRILWRFSNTVRKTYIVEYCKAGIANNALPIQIAMMIPTTTYFDVLIFRGHTMALYLKENSLQGHWPFIRNPIDLPIQRHGGEIEYRSRYRDDSHEVINGTVDLSKVPTAVSHGHVVEAAV